jgi:hypothetical protein
MFNESKAQVGVMVLIGCMSLTAALAAEKLGKAADNAIYAQTLANEVMANHPELVVIGLHALKPGNKDDEDDLAVSHERKTILAPNIKDPTKFEVAVPLHDASGKTIGSISAVFKYTAGDDEVKMHKAALAIRDDIAKKIPDTAALFKPAK